MSDLERLNDEDFAANTGVHKDLFIKLYDTTRDRCHVDTPEKLYDLLHYMKIYPADRLLTTSHARVGNTRFTIQRRLHEWRHSFYEALPYSQEVTQYGRMRHSWLNPEVNPKLPERFRAHFPVDEVIGVVDTSSFIVQQPKKTASRRRLYSGKEEACCVKAQAICDLAGRLIWWSGPYAGTASDLKIFIDDIPTWIRPGKKIMGDLAYWAPNQSATNLFLISPFKKNIGVPLLPIEQHFNNVFGHYRVKVEHVFGDIKRFNIFKDTFRQHNILENLIPWREYMHIAMYITHLTHLLHPPDIQLWQY